MSNENEFFLLVLYFINGLFSYLNYHQKELIGLNVF